MPIMAMVVMQSILCSCGNSGKPQVDEQAVKDSIENAVKDSIRNAEAVVPPNPFAGKTYEGNGNGGGLYTEMAISFLEDGKCRGTSDWYQAYSEKKTINGTAALLRYGGGQYGEGKLSVQIVGDKFQLTDPTDGTVYYQR